MIPLRTSGNRIVSSTGEPVLLRGVNRSGLEYSEQPLAGITEAEIACICRDWGANIIRLPFNQDRVLRHGEEFLAAIDQVIAWARDHGAYTLLDLQWIDSEQKIAPLPNEDSVRLWRMLAARYLDQPAVLFDIYNEPHDVSAELWRWWARLIVDNIRAINPKTLVFVSGVDWGYDLRGVVWHEEDVVFSTHPYPGKSPSWSRAFGDIAAEYPVFAGEWGGGEQDLEWGRELAAYFNRLDLGWTAWSWSDNPRLAVDGVPTAFGELVRRALGGPQTPRASSVSAAM